MTNIETASKFLDRKGIDPLKLNNFFPEYRLNSLSVAGYVSRHYPAYAGRIIRYLDGGRKYLPEPNTVIKQTLYGAWRVKVPVAILVEGPFDAIALQLKNLPAVACQGTKLTGMQRIHLRRYFKYVLVVFDNDPTGIRAVDYVMQDLKDMHIKCSSLLVEENMGAAEYLKQYGVEPFVEALQIFKNVI